MLNFVAMLGFQKDGFEVRRISSKVIFPLYIISPMNPETTNLVIRALASACWGWLSPSGLDFSCHWQNLLRVYWASRVTSRSDWENQQQSFVTSSTCIFSTIMPRPFRLFTRCWFEHNIICQMAIYYLLFSEIGQPILSWVSPKENKRGTQIILKIAPADRKQMRNNG